MKVGAFIVPTGIGASIGGFAGDASVWARRFAKNNKLIVNPNVVNAACFSGITDNMLYVEGYSLDEFFRGKLGLIESDNNKIGIIFDKSISQKVLNVHINTINAVKTVYGIDVIGFEITEEPVGVEFFIDSSGASMGNVNNLLTLKKAAEKLISKGAEAIAIVCHFPEEDDNDDNYSQGIGVDPVGGVEAIISHYISKEFRIPCAHAPAFDSIEISTDIVDSRASAEYITPTFLPCILIGLSQAPKLCDFNKQNPRHCECYARRYTSKQVVQTTNRMYLPDETIQNDNLTNHEIATPCGLAMTMDNGIISVKDVDFLIVPYNAIGSIPVMEMAKLGKKIYAVKENKTVLNVTPMTFEITCDIINTYEDLQELI